MAEVGTLLPSTEEICLRADWDGDVSSPLLFIKLKKVELAWHDVGLPAGLRGRIQTTELLGFTKRWLSSPTRRQPFI
jgi:hypothetical protein